MAVATRAYGPPVTAEIPPDAPRHYNRYTYALRRQYDPADRPSKVAATPVRTASFDGAASAAASQSPPMATSSNGPAPLLLNAYGYAIAEDGQLHARMVSPPPAQLHGAQVALGEVGSAAHVSAFGLPPPPPQTTTSLATATATVNQGAKAADRPAVRNGFVAGSSPRHSATPPTKQQPVTSPLPTATTRDAWSRAVAAAAGDFTDEELGSLTWPTLSKLLAYYHITNAIDVAHVELEWRKRQPQPIPEAVPHITQPVGQPQRNAPRSPGGSFRRTASASPRRTASASASASPRGVRARGSSLTFGSSGIAASRSVVAGFSSPQGKTVDVGKGKSISAMVVPGIPVAETETSVTASEVSGPAFVPSYLRSASYRHVRAKVDTGRSATPSRPSTPHGSFVASPAGSSSFSGSPRPSLPATARQGATPKSVS